MRIRTLTLVAMILSLLSGTALAEKYYRWVDEEGTTHYTKNPPKGEQADEVNTHYKASSSKDEEMKKLEQMRVRREKEKEQTELEKRKEKEPEEVSEEFCEQHRKNLETLQNKPIVRRENPETGEMEVIAQEEKEKMIEKTRQALEKCK